MPNEPTGDIMNPTAAPSDSFEEEFGLRSNASVRAEAAPVDVEEIDDEEIEEEEIEEESDERDEERDEEQDDELMEGEVEPDDELLGEIKGMSRSERQMLLDALLAGEDADDLNLNYRAGDKDRREPWAAVRRNAAGYFGQEEVTKKAAELKEQVAAFEEHRKKEIERITTPMRDPARFVDFMESVADKPLDYLKALVEHASARLEEAEQNPAAFHAKLVARQSDRRVQGLEAKLDQVMELLKGGKPPQEEKQEERKPKQQEFTPQQIAEYERRIGVVKKAGFDPDKVGPAYEAAGFPRDFDKWFKKYRSDNRRSDVRQNRQQEPRARVPRSLRRRGGGRPTNRAQGESWPSVDAVDKEIKAIVRERPKR